MRLGMVSLVGQKMDVLDGVEIGQRRGQFSLCMLKIQILGVNVTNEDFVAYLC